MLRIAALVISASLFLGACSETRESVLTATMKCGRAAVILQDRDLEDAASLALAKVKVGIANPAREAMEIGQKLRDEAEPQGSGTDPRFVLRVAEKWRNTDHCQKLITEFNALVKTSMNAQMRSFAEVEGAPSACPAYLEQYAATFSNGASVPYREQLIPHLRATLAETAKRLKDFQILAVSVHLEAEGLQVFAGDVARQCKESPQLLNAIRMTEVVRGAESSATHEIRAVQQALEHDSSETLQAAGNRLPVEFNPASLSPSSSARHKTECGDLPEIYCAPTLKLEATQMALRDSRQCDQDVEASSNCGLAGAAFIERRLNELELKVLSSAQAKLSRYIAEPEKFNGNTQPNVDLLSEPCKQRAVNSGLRNEAYSAHIRATCIPEAREAFLLPQRQLMSRVSDRVEALKIASSGAR